MDSLGQIYTFKMAYKIKNIKKTGLKIQKNRVYKNIIFKGKICFILPKYLGENINLSSSIFIILLFIYYSL